MTQESWGDVYRELGATPVINAIGSVTLLGGSTPAPEIKAEMERADSAYIPLMELEEKAGAVIAQMADVPAAYVTSGAGSALTLAAAACMAGDDDDSIQRLPDTTGMKNEILIQRRQRYWYDRCIEASGARLVEFGSTEGTTRRDLEEAIGPNTAAVHYYAVEQSPDPRALSLEDTIEVSHASGVPVLVDAAGQIYPLENFGKYVRMGADFQCIAAKYMGAPHSSGLALGTEETVHKISLQSFVGYEGRRIRGIGRPHKIDRQEIVGVVAAVKRLDDDEPRGETRRRGGAEPDDHPGPQRDRRRQGGDDRQRDRAPAVRSPHRGGRRAGPGLPRGIWWTGSSRGRLPSGPGCATARSGWTFTCSALADGEAEIVGERMAALFG